MASVLLGDVSPAGRLPFTWPRHVGQVPLVYAHHRTFQPEGEGSRYFEEQSTPLYQFGHGLSYATFEYSDIHQRFGSSSRPVRELKGFQRVTLQAGERETLTFQVGAEQLRYWSAATRGFVQDMTTVDVWVGGDSNAALATTLRVSD